MTVSLAPQRTLVTDTKTKPLQELNISDAFYKTSYPMSRRNETRLFHARHSTTSIRNRHQTTTVTTTSHGSRENHCFSGPTGTLVTDTKTKPVTVKSISETRVVNQHLRCLNERSTLWGPPASTGNGLLRCPLLCWHVCNGCSNWSQLLSG
jgi:hypothetical protein